MSVPAIEKVNLTKLYKLRGKNKEIKALDEFNLSIKKGEIFGLLGPNGAGKTTLMHVLTTARNPSSGVAYIDGYNVITQRKQAKSRLSLMLGASMNYGNLTGYNNLKFYAKIYKVNNYQQKINELAELFDLKEWLDQYSVKYSSGMKVKLAVCRTLLINRPILLLDEPIRGLDVSSKAFLIKKFKELKKTILLTSHDMTLVEQLCDRIGFINKGKMVKTCNKEDLKKLLHHSEFQFEVKINQNIEELKKDLNGLNFIKEFSEFNHGLVITIENRKYVKNLLYVLGNYDVLTLKANESTIEDLFKNLFQK